MVSAHFLNDRMTAADAGAGILVVTIGSLCFDLGQEALWQLQQSLDLC